MYNIEVSKDGEFLALKVIANDGYKFKDGTTEVTLELTDQFIPKVGTTVPTQDGAVIVKDAKVDDNGNVWVQNRDTGVWGRL